MADILYNGGERAGERDGRQVWITADLTSE